MQYNYITNYNVNINKINTISKEILELKLSKVQGNTVVLNVNLFCYKY
jgi:hypothetical protein